MLHVSGIIMMFFEAHKDLHTDTQLSTTWHVTAYHHLRSKYFESLLYGYLGVVSGSIFILRAVDFEYPAIVLPEEHSHHHHLYLLHNLGL